MVQQAALFADLPPALARVRDPMREAAVSDGCRWWLKRAWGAGPCILWAMANPSDADANRDDPTMQRVMDFSLRWGFGSCIVVNLVPRISPDPAMALAWWRLSQKGGEEQHGWREQWLKNLHHCIDLIGKADAHVAAWGNCLPEEVSENWRQALAELTDCCIDEDEQKPVEWLCLGTNSNGSPRHPLSRGKNRVPDDFQPIKWK